MNVLLSVVLLFGANVYNDAFDSAAKAYAGGNYAAAIDQYEQLVAEGVSSSAVFYNLANAYYRAGQLVPAIANYERALQLDPGLENARENLDRAVRETPHQLARPLPPDWEQSMLFWHYNLSRRVTYFLAFLTWVGFWGILVVRQWRPFRYTRAAALVAFLFALAFGASAWAKAHPEALAVAGPEKVEVRYGTDENETVYFDLSTGDRVTVDRHQNGWARVTTADAKRGWTQDANLIFVGPPYLRPAGNPPLHPKETQTK